MRGLVRPPNHKKQPNTMVSPSLPSDSNLIIVGVCSANSGTVCTVPFEKMATGVLIQYFEVQWRRRPFFLSVLDLWGVQPVGSGRYAFLCGISPGFLVHAWLPWCATATGVE